MNQLKLFTSLLIWFCSIQFNLSFCQNIDWLVKSGGLKSDKGTTIVIDAEGNSYITGYYNEEANFGTFNTGFSFDKSKEVFVAKLDPDGNYLWVTNAINYFDDRGLGLCLDPFGNVYVTGTCWGGLEWDGLNVYNSSSFTDQTFVTKFNSDGQIVWMKNAGVDSWETITAWWDPFQTIYCDDHGFDIISDSDGNLFVTGYISSVDLSPTTANFDAISIPMNYGDTLGYLAKLSNDGNWEWVKTFEGVYLYRDNAVGIDDDDNVYVAGGFKGTRSFETDVLNSNQGSLDIFVLKYDNDGNYQYVVQVGDTLDDRADGITYGNDNHMYVTGEFRGEVFFGTDDLNNYGGPEDKDIFVSKMSKDGDWIWATKAGSKKGGDRGIGICANKQGNVFVSGQFRGNAKFGQVELISNYASDSTQFFVSMIDSSGNWQWVIDGGGIYTDRINSVAVDDSCNLYFVGYFKEAMSSGEFNLIASGSNDILVGKIVDACNSPIQPPTAPGSEVVDEFNPSNVFSPNNDGVNDALAFTNDPNIRGSVVILNRWGNVVYESDDLTKKWNGKSQSGIDVIEGVYFYKIEYALNATNKPKSGFVSVVR